jgi:hypothetical protein
VEGGQPELDELEVMPSPARENGFAGRIGRPVGWLLLAAASPVLAAVVAPTPYAKPAAAVRGKLFLKGKTLSFPLAWLVRGPDTFDEKKASAYLILSSRDIAAAISACKDIHCVIFDAVTDGAVLQPADDGHNSFWLRVKTPELPKEQQLSGRTWTATVDQHDRLAGKLQFAYENTRDEADLEIDAVLVKEFPLGEKR